jgi:hypothetical protein
MKNALLDELIAVNGLKNDAALCRLLSIAPPVISKIRKGYAPVTPSVLLKMHELGNLPIARIRELAAIKPEQEPKRADVLVAALRQIARLGNGENLGNSTGNAIAINALFLAGIEP